MIYSDTSLRHTAAFGRDKNPRTDINIGPDMGMRQAVDRPAEREACRSGRVGSEKRAPTVSRALTQLCFTAEEVVVTEGEIMARVTDARGKE